MPRDRRHGMSKANLLQRLWGAHGNDHFNYRSIRSFSDCRLVSYWLARGLAGGPSCSQIGTGYHQQAGLECRNRLGVRSHYCSADYDPYNWHYRQYLQSIAITVQLLELFQFAFVISPVVLWKHRPSSHLQTLRTSATLLQRRVQNQRPSPARLLLARSL